MGTLDMINCGVKGQFKEFFSGKKDSKESPDEKFEEVN